MAHRNAPPRSWPSMAMLITPARSHSTPAKAPNTSGTAQVIVSPSRNGNRRVPVLADITQTRNITSTRAPKATRYQRRGLRAAAAMKAAAVRAKVPMVHTISTSLAGACQTGHCQDASGSMNADWASAVEGVNSTNANSAAMLITARVIGVRQETEPSTSARSTPSGPTGPGVPAIIGALMQSSFGTTAAAPHSGRPPPSTYLRGGSSHSCSHLHGASTAGSAGQVEHGAHQRWGGDEQHDHRLDHQHDVDRGLRGGLHQRRAGPQRPEQQGGAHDATGTVPAEQRHGDRIEADRARRAGAQGVVGAEDLRGTAEAGEQTGGDHHHHEHQVHVDAGGAGGVHVRAHRPELEPDGRAFHQPPHAHGSQQRQHEAPVQPEL